MTQQTAERHLTVPPFSVHAVGAKFVEIHFRDRAVPPKATRKYLAEHGFRFYQDCNGREEPRYGSKQSKEAWQFVKSFTEEYGDEILHPDAIPEEYREEIERSPVYAPTAIAPPRTLVIPQPPPEPMTRTKVAPGQLDFSALFEDIFAIANEAVAELDEAAQRRAKLLAELERWKSWRAEWIGGEYRWLLVNSAIAMLMTGSAIAVYRAAANPVEPAIEEGEDLKKREPLSLPELPPESTAEVEAHTDNTTETHADPIERSEEPILILTPPSSPEPQAVVRKKQKPKVRAKFPKPKLDLSRGAHWLGDDDLLGTEQYIGCYALLDGQLGLSFKGLAHSLTMRIEGEEYVAQPGTFQPLLVDDWVRDRIAGLIKIWDTYSHLVAAEANPDLDDDDVELRREYLNFAYDDFVAQHGYIHQNKGLTHFCGNTDTRLYMLMALEQEDGDNGEYGKASIFRNRQQYPAPPITGQVYFDEDPIERCRSAFIKCLDVKGLRFDLEFTAQLAGLEPDLTEEYLLDLGLIYREPILD